jgi:multidrug resistance efflux pump
LKKIIVALIFIALFVAAVRYYQTRPGPSELTLTGIVTTEDVMVSPQISGQIQKLLVKEGDSVARNQLIATIQPAELQADSAYYKHSEEGVASTVQQNEAALRYQQRQNEDSVYQAEQLLTATMSQQAESKGALESAKIDLDRAKALMDAGVGPVQQYDQARAAYEAAKAHMETLLRQVDVQRAAVALAKSSSEQVAVRQGELAASQHQKSAAAAQKQKADVRLSYTEVRAPISGIVDVRPAREGEVLNMGQPIVTLIDPDDLWVRADVEETYIDRIRLGDRMKLRLPSGDVRDGTVIYRAVDAGFATQRDVSRTKRDIKTFEIRLRVDNTDRRLAVGMTAYVLLPLR